MHSKQIANLVSLHLATLQVLNASKEHRGRLSSIVPLAIIEGHVSHMTFFLDHAQVQLSKLRQVGVKVNWPDVPNNQIAKVKPGPFNMKLAVALLSADMPANAALLAMQAPTGEQGCRFGCRGESTYLTIEPTMENLHDIKKARLMEILDIGFDAKPAGNKTAVLKVLTKKLHTSSTDDLVAVARKLCTGFSSVGLSHDAILESIVVEMFRGEGKYAGVHFDNVHPSTMTRQSCRNSAILVAAANQWKLSGGSAKSVKAFEKRTGAVLCYTMLHHPEMH